jgi:hypothetical protein
MHVIRCVVVRVRGIQITLMGNDATRNLNAYLVATAAFAIVVLVGGVVRSVAGVHPFYLVLLFALCGSSFVGVRKLNDRRALLLAFSAVYFLYFGATPLLALFLGPESSAPTNEFMNATEAVILVGCALAQVGYRVASNSSLDTKATAGWKDWSERSMLWIGGGLWVVSTAMTWQFKVHIVVSTLSEDVEKGLGSLNPWLAGGFILAIMLQPLGILIATYAQCRYKRFYMMPVLIAMVLTQLLMGFVTDVKADALTGALVVIVTKVLVEGRLPKSWIVALIAFVAVAFPVLQANRVARGMSGADHSDAAKDIGQTIAKAIELSKDSSPYVEQQQSFLERLSLVGSVQTIVTHTGVDAPFQHGYTLTPMLTTFIPRVIWPNKPDVQAGRVMNKEFHISPVADTYISPSHLGELYWNFGWTGVVLGMTFIGALFGYVGRRIDFENTITLTHLMVAMVTVRLLIMGFEGTIAAQYIVWMRSMLAIGLLHLVLAKAPPFVRTARAAVNTTPSLSPSSTAVSPRFSNLLR